MRWTDQEKKRVRKELEQATSKDDAVRRARAVAPNRDITFSALEILSRREGWASIQTWVAKNGPRTPAAILDYREKRDATRDALKERDHLAKDLASANKRIEVLTNMRAHPPVKLGARSRAGKDPKQRMGIPVMLCSDWHVEEPVDPVKVAGLNTYSLEIADRCIQRLAEAYIWMLRDKRFDVREGVIWLGGDLFSGFIHEELVEGNFLSPIRALLWLQPRIETMLRTIARETNLEKIVVVCNDGNHGRTTHKIRVSTRTDNSYEYLLYQELAHRMSNDPRFVFQIAEGEYEYLDVYKQTLCFFHGDSVRYQGGVGGLIIPMKRGLNELRKYKKVDVFNFGHFHTGLDLPEMVGNGSMIGINPYSMRLKCQPEPRQQRWYMMDSEQGKCLSAPIWL